MTIFGHIAMNGQTRQGDKVDKIAPLRPHFLSPCHLVIFHGGTMDTGLSGKVAVITGAAQGQGRAAALALAREGAHIAGLDVARTLNYPGYRLGSPDALAKLAAECEDLGVR